MKIIIKKRTKCKNCYNIEKRKYNKVSEKLSVNDECINIQTLLVGPIFLGKTYLLLKFLSRIPNRDIYIITKSSREQYSNSKSHSKEICAENKPLNEDEKAIVVSDDILVSRNSKYLDQFFLRGEHKELVICYLSQSYFDLTKKYCKK